MSAATGVRRPRARLGAAALATALAAGAATGAAMLAPRALAAQSLTSLRGLGHPIVAVDSRTEIMGGLGIGLQGFGVPMTNPAAPAGVYGRGAVVALSSTERTIELDGASEHVGATRFPLIRLLFPVRTVTLSLGYGGYLDQSWSLIREGSEILESDTVAFRDIMQSTGGIGQLQLGAAVPLGERLAIGVVIGSHTGSQRIDYRRLFDSTAVGNLNPYRETLGWRYSGVMAQVGARWDPIDAVRLGASVTWAGSLTADSTDGSAAAREVDLPLQVAAGASAYLAPGLLAAVSGRWNGWSATRSAVFLPGADEAIDSRDTWEVGGGLEWLDPAAGRSPRSWPVRVGFQYRQLPFPFGAEAPVEWFAGAGGGLLLGDPSNPAAAIDLSLQRGARTAAGGEGLGDLTETMWRLGLTVSLFGN